MSQEHYLIVEQQQPSPKNLAETLKQLSQKFQLDIYQCRQRLTGRGLSLLTRGKHDTLAKISELLQEAGFSHWLLRPSKSGFVPLKVHNLHICADHITFGCRKQEVVFPKGGTILAVFAEISGELVDKSIKHLLSSHAYRGRDNIAHLDDAKIRKTILQGKPVLDLYLLDKNLQVEAAVRILPGKFDPQGLAERATLSSKQNLEQILKLAEEYAGKFQLQTDFGLSNLPGCTLRREGPDNPETQRQNLLNLARYGWLMADLLKAGEIKPPQINPENELTGTVATAILLQNPTLAAERLADEILPIFKEISAEIDAPTEQQEKKSPNTSNAANSGLPTPPPAQSGADKSKLRLWITTSGAVIFVLLFLLPEGISTPFFNLLAFHSINSGAIPIFFAVLMLWYAFYFLRLKRQIENTPTSKIRSIAMGMVEVKGTAIRKFAQVSPMSHTPCVFYRLTKYRRDINNKWQVSSISSSNNVPFLLEDETGQVEIDPSGCRVSAGSKQEGSLGQIGLMQTSDDRDDKWVEEVIVAGTLIYVLGYASVKPTAGLSLAAQKIAALRKLKQNRHDMQRFDRDGDGSISADEWDTAREATEKQVLRESLQNRQQRKKQEDHIVIGKKNNRPLIIAETHSEDHLTTRYLYYSIPLFMAAAAATGGSIWLLLNYWQ